VYDVGTGAPGKTFPGHMTSFTLVLLTPATEYRAVIYAVNAGGYSENPSEQACATTSVS